MDVNIYGGETSPSSQSRKAFIYIFRKLLRSLKGGGPPSTIKMSSSHRAVRLIMVVRRPRLVMVVRCPHLAKLTYFYYLKVKSILLSAH